MSGKEFKAGNKKTMGEVFNAIMRSVPPVAQRAVIFLVLGGLITFGGLSVETKIAKAQDAADRTGAMQQQNAHKIIIVETRLDRIEQTQAASGQKISDIKDTTDSLDRKIDVLLARSK